MAINCSQTCSMQVSKSCAPEGSGFAARASGTSFGFTLDGEVFGSGTPFFAVRLCLEVSPSTFCAPFCAALAFAFWMACSTSLRNPSRFSKAWLTVRSVYSCWKGCFHSSAIFRTLAIGSPPSKPAWWQSMVRTPAVCNCSIPARMAIKSACINSMSVRRSRKLKRMNAKRAAGS